MPSDRLGYLSRPARLLLIAIFTLASLAFAIRLWRARVTYPDYTDWAIVALVPFARPDFPRRWLAWLFPAVVR